MDPSLLDPILQRQDLMLLIELYRVSKELKALIDNDLERIKNAFGLTGDLNLFQDIVEAYERSILDLPFNLSIARAVDYSPKLIERVIKEHPLPFYYIRKSREVDSYFDSADQNLRKLHYQPDHRDFGDYTLNFTVLDERSNDSELNSPDKYLTQYISAIFQAMEKTIIQDKLDVLQILIKLYNSLKSLRNRYNSLSGEINLGRLVEAQKSEELNKIMKLLIKTRY